jgi:hypothetical protein
MPIGFTGIPTRRTVLQKSSKNARVYRFLLRADFLYVFPTQLELSRLSSTRYYNPSKSGSSSLTLRELFQFQSSVGRGLEIVAKMADETSYYSGQNGVTSTFAFTVADGHFLFTILGSLVLRLNSALVSSN